MILLHKQITLPYNLPVIVVSAAKRLLVVCLPLGLLLTACSQEMGTPEIAPSLVPLATVTAQMAATSEAEMARATTAAAPEETSTAGDTDQETVDEPDPTPTETLPQTISVSDQELRDDGRLIVERVEVNQPGWLVIYADDNDEPGEILGYTEIPAGVTEDVAVEVEAEDQTDSVTKERIQNMVQFVASTSDWYEKISSVPTPTLQKLMKLGTGITGALGK